MLEHGHIRIIFYSINIQHIDCYCVKELWCCFPMPSLIIHLFYDGTVDIQIWGLLTGQCKVFDTQLTVKASCFVIKKVSVRNNHFTFFKQFMQTPVIFVKFCITTKERDNKFWNLLFFSFVLSICLINRIIQTSIWIVAFHISVSGAFLAQNALPPNSIVHGRSPPPPLLWTVFQFLHFLSKTIQRSLGGGIGVFIPNFARLQKK